MDQDLQTIATAVSRADNVSDMAGTMLDVLQRFAPLETTYLTRVERLHGRQRVLFARHRGDPIVREGDTFAWEESICARALAAHETQVTDAIGRWPDCEAARQLGVRTYVTTPVYNDDGALFGTLCGISRHEDALSGADLQAVLDLFGQLLAHQIERETRIKTSEQRAAQAELQAAEMAFLNTIGDLCLNATGLQTAVAEVARLKTARRDWGRAVPFYREDGETYPGWPADAAVVAHVDAALANELNQGPSADGRVHGGFVVLNAAQPGVRRLRAQAGFGADGTTALITATTGTGLHGGVVLLDEGITAIRDSDVRLLTNCSNYLSLLAERLEYVAELRQANHELRQTASHDALTGLRNRRYLIEAFERLLAQAQRFGETIHVAFIDLDDFKALNDAYGHETGDHFLIAVAERLKQTVRASDVVARYGGDEFVVLAPAINPDGSRYERHRLAARLYEATQGLYHLASVSLDYEGPSIGVITVEDDENDPDRILARADSAMYDVKQRRKLDRSRRPTAP
jgi:diguanylate cyclase (GGDEF)-like protein